MQKPYARLISFWELMNEYRAGQFWWMSQELLRLQVELRGPVDRAWVDNMRGIMGYIESQCKHGGFNLADLAMVPYCNIAAELQRFEIVVNYQIDVESIRREIKALRKNMELVLHRRKFVSVAEDNTKYFEQEKLFGDVVYEKFEEARQDIRDAGNCFAVDLPNACVFHLMRVSEIGLRHVAARVGVKLKDKGKPQAIEYATWDKVIHGIQGQITKARTLPQGARKARRLSFFSDAAELCSYIKDIWRNEISHTRKRFNENEALGAMERVKSFMQLLTGEPQ